MKKLSVAFLTLFLTALCASCAFSMILRSPDPLGKGLSEVSADMQNVQYGSTDRSMVGIGYEYGMTDRFGAKIGLEDDSVTNRSSSTHLFLGGSYALLTDSQNGCGVSLQGFLSKELAKNFGGTVSSTIVIDAKVLMGKRYGKFYPFIGLGLHTDAGSQAREREIFWEANLSTKIDFTQSFNGVISGNYAFAHASGTSPNSSLSGYLAYSF